MFAILCSIHWSEYKKNVSTIEFHGLASINWWTGIELLFFFFFVFSESFLSLFSFLHHEKPTIGDDIYDLFSKNNRYLYKYRKCVLIALYI